MAHSLDAAADSATDVTSVVSARSLTKIYGRGDAEVHALRGVDIDVPRGQFVAVMGPSGSGKSTLMHLLAGLDVPTSGTVEIDDVGLHTLNDKQLTLLRREKVGFVFQFFNLLPMLTAAENIDLPLNLAGRKADRTWRDGLIDTIGIRGRLSHKPSELSGGQQQRVAIARALVSQPVVVFGDEPTGNLDSKTGSEVLDVLRNSVDAYQQTIVIVTHDSRAAAMADRVVFLEDGLIVRDEGRLSADEILDTIKGLEA
jgi:putative ABC transport system ATP-binding protein